MSTPSLYLVALASLIGGGLVASAVHGRSVPAVSPVEQSVTALLTRTFAVGAPELTLVSGADVIAAIDGKTVRGDSWELRSEWSCLLHESYVARSEIFPSTSNANHSAGTSGSRPADWGRWAQKHGTLSETNVTFYRRGLEDVRTFSGIASKTLTSQGCRVFTANASAGSMIIPLATVTTKLRQLDFTAAPGGAAGYTARFAIEFSPLYADVVIAPAKLTGHARVVISAETHEAQLVDYTVDQLAHDGDAISVTYSP